MGKEECRQNTMDERYRNRANRVCARLIYLNALQSILDAEISELE